MEITAAYTKNVNLDLNSDPDTDSDLDSDAIAEHLVTTYMSHSSDSKLGIE